MTKAYLAFGSNLGDRLSSLVQAVIALRADRDINFQRFSSVYETAPVGVVDQPAFLNLVAEISTVLTPSALLAQCLEVETAAGRIRGERWGPRILDLDLLWYDGRRIAEERLSLPHPRMLERAFVLIPLAEIAPQLMLDGESAQHRAAKSDASGVRLFSKLPVAEAQVEDFGR